MKLYDEIDNSSRGFVGAGGQLNILDRAANKYKLLIPVETLPSVTGSVDTVENDVTTSPVKGQIEGKYSLENKDITFLWNRDDLSRLMEYAGEQQDFLISYADGTGWKFSGKYNLRPEDVGASDKATGTITIIPSNSDIEPTLNVADMLMKTCIITSVIPSDTVIDKLNGTITYTLKASSSNAIFTKEVDNDAISANIVGDKLTISTTSSTETNGIVKVIAKAEGQASWFVTTRVFVE